MVEARTIHEQVIEIATLGDEAWFANNPHRRIRLRNAVPMEFAGEIESASAGMVLRTLVLEAQPGVRLRQPLALPADVAMEDMGDDALFALFMQAAPPEAKETLKKLRATKLPGVPKAAASR
jgi:hypothetical protein